MIVKWLGRQVHQSWVVVFLCVGIVVGVVLGMVMRVNYFASPVWVGVCVAVMIVGYLKPRVGVMVLAVVAGMILSFVRVAGELSGEDYVRRLYGHEVVVAGVVSGDPETDEGVTKLKLTDLRFGEEKVRSAGSIYVTLGKNEELAREDRVVLSGKMSEGFGTYVGYMYRLKLVGWERPEPGSWVLLVRNWFAERVRSVVPESEASLGLSYLLGMKTGGLSDELSENLRVVGLTHIVVASGAHLAILVEVARKIFGRLSRFAGLLFSVLFVVFFMAMVGWTPSILRAGMMTILTLVAWYSGRVIAPWRLILMVGAVTLLIQPEFVINMGWQLSFASYSGIMVLGPRLTKWFYGKKKPGFVGSMILTTVSATVMTLPIILYYYGAVSLISVIANLLILPTLPYAMGLTFLAGVFAGAPGVSVAVSWCAKLLLDFHIAVVGWFGGMREFLVEMPKYQWQVFIIYGIILIIMTILLLRRKMIKLRKDKCKDWGVNMSGHSKWATTKRQKAVVDAKRGALFTKIGNQIAIAARSGTDPAMNPSLAMMLEKARHANMPKANIERAIARAADKSAAALIEEVYEAYGPGGVGIVIEVATDNKNRTLPEVRHTLDKNGGRMADSGSVMFQFARKGVIEVSEKGDEVMMAALEAGAEDVSDEDEGVIIYTDASDLMKVRQGLLDAGLTVNSAELQYVPSSYVPVEGENAEKLEKLLSAIDELDDVTNTYTNAE